MKLDDRKKKWMTVGGAGVLCVVLIVLIAGQFQNKPVESVRETTIKPEKTTISITIESKEGEDESETVRIETESETTVRAEKEQTDETVQEIQPEVTKPAAPKEEEKHDPTKKPNGETVKPAEPEVPVTDSVQPVVPTETEPQITEPPVEIPTEASTEPVAAAPEEGQIYVPGFGWVTPSGSIGREVDSDGDINKQVGIMD